MIFEHSAKSSWTWLQTIMTKLVNFLYYQMLDPVIFQSFYLRKHPTIRKVAKVFVKISIQQFFQGWLTLIHQTFTRMNTSYFFILLLFYCICLTRWGITISVISKYSRNSITRISITSYRLFDLTWGSTYAQSWL